LVVTIRKTASVLLAVAMLAAPTVVAQSDDPEIEDETGDVDVQHLVDADVFDEADVDADQAEAVGDIVKSRVYSETEESFSITTQLAEIPKEEDQAFTIAETWMHFTVRDAAYHAVAELGAPTPGDPMQAEFALHSDDGGERSIAGSVDAKQNTVTWEVAKPDVRDPGDGDRLTEFYATTHLAEGQALDYAPGANGQSLPATEDPTGVDPTSLTLSPTAEYGDEYAFSSFEDVQADIDVEATPSQATITAGESSQFVIRVNNDAAESDSVSLTVANAPSDWSASLQPTQMDLDAGDSGTATLTVSPSSDSTGTSILSVSVASELGAKGGADLAVAVEQPETQTDSQQDASDDSEAAEDDGDASTEESDDASQTGPDEAEPAGESSGSKEDQNESPLPGFALVLVALGAVAAAKASRR